MKQNKLNKEPIIINRAVYDTDKKYSEKELQAELSKQKEDILKKLVGEPINCKLCEGICKKYLRNRKKYEDILKELK